MIELWRIGLCIASIIVGSFGPIYLKRGTKKLNRKDIRCGRGSSTGVNEKFTAEFRSARRGMFFATDLHG